MTGGRLSPPAHVLRHRSRSISEIQKSLQQNPPRRQVGGENTTPAAPRPSGECTQPPNRRKGNPMNRATPHHKTPICESLSSNRKDMTLKSTPSPSRGSSSFEKFRRTRKPLLLIFTIVAMLTAVTGTGGASGTAPASGSSSDGILFVPHSNPLPGALTVVEPGLKKDGECLIQGHLEGDGGSPGAIVQRIVKVNLTTCRITLERLEIALDDLHRYDSSITSSGAAQDSRTATVNGASSAGVGAMASAAVTHYFGSIKFNWEDPPQIDVTTTKSSVNWRQTQGSSCLSGADFGASWGWYSPTGWSRRTASWQHDFDCGYASMNTYGTYHNSTFCPTAATDTDHYNTFFSGKPNGAWYVQWGANKSGGCTNLLSPEHIIVHP